MFLVVRYYNRLMVLLLVRLLLLSLVGGVVMVTASLILVERDGLGPTSGVVVASLPLVVCVLLRIHFYYIIVISIKVISY
jgi:hypothetical protein